MFTGSLPPMQLPGLQLRSVQIIGSDSHAHQIQVVTPVLMLMLTLMVTMLMVTILMVALVGGCWQPITPTRQVIVSPPAEEIS